MISTKRLDLIERKLKAIQDKDLGRIVARNTYIPFIGRPTETKAVADWLKIRSDTLEQAKVLSVGEIEARIVTERDALSKQGKDVVDGKEAELKPEEYDAICVVWLLKFSLGESE